MDGAFTDLDPDDVHGRILSKFSYTFVMFLHFNMYTFLHFNLKEILELLSNLFLCFLYQLRNKKTPSN